MFEIRDRKDRIEREDRSVTDGPMIRGDSWDLAPDVLRTNEEECPKERDLTAKSTEKRKNNFEIIGKQQKEKDSKVTSNSKNTIQMKDEERLDNVQQLEKSSQARNVERWKDEKSSHETVEGCDVLTAKTIDLSDSKDYPEDLNPFKSDEEDSSVEDKRRIAIDSCRSDRVSTNPFDSEDEDVEELEPPKPAARSQIENWKASTGTPATKRVLAAPQINLNPFWSDEEEEEERDSDEERRDRTLQGSAPVPKPRTIIK